MKNKGFSLVELIIVIAIMGILVGVLTPTLLIYVNKTKVSADIQLCDSVQEALSINIIEAATYDVLDSVSKTQIANLQSGNAVLLKGLDDTSLFCKDVTDMLGVNCCATGFNSLFQSSVAKNYGELYAQTYNGEIVVWIDNSNATGRNSVITCNDASQIDEKVISSL